MGLEQLGLGLGRLDAASASEYFLVRTYQRNTQRHDARPDEVRAQSNLATLVGHKRVEGPYPLTLTLILVTASINTDTNCSLALVPRHQS